MLKEKYNTKSEGEIMNAMDCLLNNHYRLEKWMWQKTIYKLYSTEERDKIEQKINELI